jgi:hypothetical protein
MVLGAREVNQVKAMPDNDKGNILNFKASLVLDLPHYKINWPTCSSVVLPSSPLKFKKLSKRKLQRGLIIKATVIRWIICCVLCCIVVGVV